ncbi:TonB-dependent receptor domain-containing protein [Pontibacterium sp.]|uniref:TonB-dependent receptor domain-containing protein n=1 Tax=Pontibacterium sp. TaxID=2036026 RepID=UPI003517D438
MKTTLSLSAALLAALPAYAQETELDTVIVSANRIEQPITETLAPVSVITREEIEEKNITSLKQALTTLPGISIISSGGKAQSTSLFTRGTNSSHTLILLNGQRINSATLGTTMFNLIPVDQIDRIEYVRGPRSTLYGSDAIGGILQIFTNQKPSENVAKVSVSAGSDNTQIVSGSVRRQINDQTYYSVHVSDEQSGGYDVRDSQSTDNDGYSIRTLSASINHQINAQFDIQANSDLWKGDYEFDPNFGGDETEFNNYAHGLKLSYLRSNLASSLSLGISQDDSLTFGNGTTKANGSKFVTQHKEVNWLNNITVGDYTDLTAGIDFKQDDVSNSSQTYDVEERDTTSVFAGVIHSVGPFDLESSVRRTKDEQFGFKNTWSLAGSWNFDNGVQLGLSRGIGFKAPTFNDLYFPANAFGAGNPDLKPEESKSTELSLSGGEQVRWAISLYETDIHNLIVWTEDPPGFWKPSNVNDANIKGLEVSTSFNFASVDHTVALDLLDPTDDQTGKDLVNRPERQLKWQMAYAVKQNFSVGGDLLYQGKRFTDAANTTSLPSNTLVNLYLSYTPYPKLELGVRVDNVLNKQYQSNQGFNAPDRQLMLTLGYSF